MVGGLGSISPELKEEWPPMIRFIPQVNKYLDKIIIDPNSFLYTF